MLFFYYILAPLCRFGLFVAKTSTFFIGNRGSVVVCCVVVVSWLLVDFGIFPSGSAEIRLTFGVFFAIIER